MTYINPLILDLNGDGVQLLDADNAKVLFDIDHDGTGLAATESILYLQKSN